MKVGVLESTITKIAEAFDDELMNKTQEELEGYWFFKFEDTHSLEINMYEFYDKLELYHNFCRRWEEKKNGSCCVVERVRDKYLMPKIKEFAEKVRKEEPDEG